MENYAKIKLLGEGSFGKVLLMREKQLGGRLVCVKEIHSIHTPSNSSAPVMEVQLMKKLSHPHLIRFLASFSKSSSANKKGVKSCIVMEFCSGGDLRAYLSKHRHGSGDALKARHQLTEDQIWFWFLQLCLGLQHMHELQILHRDVKTANIFLSNAGFIVLGDFGIARELSGPRDMASTVIGTPLYMAPETLEGRPYSFASDLWALGCVLYEICTGEPPFTAKSTPALVNKICEGKFTPLSRARFSLRLQELVAAMLSVDVRHRPTAVSILKHPDIQVHLKRYFHDRFILSSGSHRQQEDQVILSKQLQSLGVTVTVSLLNAGALTAKLANEGHSSDVDSVPRASEKERVEAKLMAERELERHRQLLVALDKLQRLRLQEGLSDTKHGRKDEGEQHDDKASEQRPSPVFPHVRRASQESEIRWKDPVVQDRPRPSSPGRDREASRKNNTNSTFLGIPRKGVPLTTQAKDFASHSPVCKDVRVLRQQERTKAADQYKQGLAAVKPLRTQPEAAACGASQQLPARAQCPVGGEPTDDAILHSIQELQAALGGLH